MKFGDLQRIVIFVKFDCMGEEWGRGQFPKKQSHTDGLLTNMKSW